MITLLDYGAGNVRSVINAIESLGETIRPVEKPEDILAAYVYLLGPDSKGVTGQSIDAQ